MSVLGQSGWEAPTLGGMVFPEMTSIGNGDLGTAVVLDSASLFWASGQGHQGLDTQWTGSGHAVADSVSTHHTIRIPVIPMQSRTLKKYCASDTGADTCLLHTEQCRRVTGTSLHSNCKVSAVPNI